MKKIKLEHGSALHDALKGIDTDMTGNGSADELQDGLGGM